MIQPCRTPESAENESITTMEIAQQNLSAYVMGYTLIVIISNT